MSTLIENFKLKKKRLKQKKEEENILRSPLRPVRILENAEKHTPTPFQKSNALTSYTAELTVRVQLTFGIE